MDTDGFAQVNNTGAIVSSTIFEQTGTYETKTKCCHDLYM